jgi:adenylate cyclase
VAREQRKLAAILAADVAGYSRLMGRDESGTLARLRAHRKERLEPAIARYGGRLVKLTGDGALIEFASAVDALSAAIEFQQAVAHANLNCSQDERIDFRIGLHLGDMIVDGDDLYGDGVNIAARLEAGAPPGGIIVSRAVREAVDGRLKAKLSPLGELALKNIERPVRAFRVEWNAADWQAIPTAAPEPVISMAPALSLPDTPSIAVLPFSNISGDPEQEYFADGITEDIITELSRFHELFIIARNSSFTYKHKAIDVRAVARELGVRYVVEGSTRKVANRVRVTAQLIDAVSGSHIWAERYDRVLEDVFAVQEELTRSIVRAVAPHIRDAEASKARRRPQSLSGYEIAVRANAKSWEAYGRSDPVLFDKAIAEARSALAIDPTSTLALNAIAFAQWHHLNLGTATDREAAWADGIAAASRAIEVDRSDSGGHAFKGMLLVYAPDRARMDEAMPSLRRAVELNPHNATALNALAFGEILVGHPETAIEHLHQALRSSPRDPQRSRMYLFLAIASACLKDYAKGIEYSLLGIEEAPGIPALDAYLAVNYVGSGDIDKSKEPLAEERRIAPRFVERALAGGLMLRNQEHLRRVTTFLRIAAGLEDPSAADALR